MTNAVENQSNEKPSSPINAQTIVIGLLVLGAVALIAYQIFGCSSCYL